MEVHHRENEYPVGLSAVDNTEGKASCLASAHIFIQHRPRLWVALYSVDRRVDLDEKVVAKSRLARFVVVDRGLELFLGVWMERELHFENRAWIRRSTSSPGTASTVPERSSSSLWRATSVH